MVEIIRRGIKPEDKVYETTCRHCQSILRFKRSEAKYHSDQREGDALEITCPVCEKLVWTDMKALTEIPVVTT